MRAEATTTIGIEARGGAWAAVICALWGHRVHYTRVTGSRGAPCTRCGAVILRPDGGVSRIGHTLSCFFAGHRYTRIDGRCGHHEYVCDKCGHPLLFEAADDPYAARDGFKKRVRYACGLFGHRVHVVGMRGDDTEYTCGCGHSFVRPQRVLRLIHHPPLCVVLGHFVALSEIRGKWAEYLCRGCGHPFCFKAAPPDRPADVRHE